MKNSLIKMRIINEEVKMKREEIRDYERQSKLLVANLRTILGEEHVNSKYKTLVDSVDNFYK